MGMPKQRLIHEIRREERDKTTVCRLEFLLAPFGLKAGLAVATAQHQEQRFGVFEPNTLILCTGLLGRKRGIFVLVTDEIAEEHSAKNIRPTSRPPQAIIEERYMTNLHLFAVPDAIPAYSVVRRIGPADLKDALTKGFNDFLPILDFLAKPLFTVMFSIIYAIICIYLISSDLPLLFPLMSGFALIGPFVAIGLYELSRRRELGLDTCWTHVFDLRRSPSLPSILALGLVLLTIFICWQAAAEQLFVWLFGPTAPESLSGFLTEVITTSRGWTLIILGNATGFLFAVVVLSISVVSFPLLLDRNVGVAVAVHTSVTAVLANPLTMALWGLIVAASLVIGFLFFALAFVVPVLAHASWHLYRSVVQ